MGVQLGSRNRHISVANAPCHGESSWSRDTEQVRSVVELIITCVAGVTLSHSSGGGASVNYIARVTDGVGVGVDVSCYATPSTVRVKVCYATDRGGNL